MRGRHGRAVVVVVPVREPQVDDSAKMVFREKDTFRSRRTKHRYQNSGLERESSNEGTINIVVDDGGNSSAVLAEEGLLFKGDDSSA